jgi:urease accessory protein
MHRHLLIVALVAGLPGLALAHPAADAGAHHGLLAGFLHPLGGIDHLAAMLAIGLWTALAARRGRADLVLAPLTFIALLLTGALLTHAGLALPAVEPLVAVSLLGLGLLVALRARWPLPWVLPAVGAFGLLHGAAHGSELGGMAALVGMVLGSGLLHAVGVVVGLVGRHHGAWFPRLAGAGIGLLGTTLLLGLAR